MSYVILSYFGKLYEYFLCYIRVEKRVIFVIIVFDFLLVTS